VQHRQEATERLDIRKFTISPHAGRQFVKQGLNQKTERDLLFGPQRSSNWWLRVLIRTQY
jgi:hypothetical protein